MQILQPKPTRETAEVVYRPHMRVNNTSMQRYKKNYRSTLKNGGRSVIALGTECEHPVFKIFILSMIICNK